MFASIVAKFLFGASRHGRADKLKGTTFVDAADTRISDTDPDVASQITVSRKSTGDSWSHDTHSLSYSDSGDESESTQLHDGSEEVKYWKEKAAALSGEVSTLKYQTILQNASLDQMQASLEQEDKMHSDRVLMLEMEVVRLIKMQNKAGRNDESTDCSSSSLASRPSSRLPAHSALKDEINCDTLQHANLEISALEEVLARVLAERDELSSKTKNLESLVTEMSDTSNMKAMADRYYRHDESKGSIVYQLTCRKCNGRHNITGTTDQDLRRKVKGHFREIWNMVQCDIATVDSNSSSDGETDCSGRTPFSRTHFAQHIADHCQDATSDEDAMKWCLKNVKVEVLKITSLD